jgi:hypothetical protein
MAQEIIVGPNKPRQELNTGDETPERGWNPKRILDAINTMFTELYASVVALQATQTSLALSTASIVRFTDMTVSPAELLALNATPKTLVAAPGAGLANIFEGAVAFLDYNSAAYAGIAAGEDLAVKYTNGSGLQVGSCETDPFLTGTADATRFIQAYRASSGASDITPVANAALVLHLLSGEITTGDSPLIVRTYYRVVPTTL